MAEVNSKVMEMVTQQLEKNPDVSNADLREKAEAIDPGIKKLDARQFNARYPLQVKRAMKPRRARRRKKTTARASSSRRNGGRNEKVRAVLLDLAKDVANAQGKGDVVDVIAGIDRYVDRVVKAVG